MRSGRNVEYLRRRAGAARFDVKCVSYLILTALVIDKYCYYIVAQLADIGVGARARHRSERNTANRRELC